MAASFKLPNGSDIYIDSISHRCDSLINSSIWSGIERNHLRNWLRSFNTNEDKYFASILLDNLIFRSNQQTKALMIQGMQRSLPEALKDLPQYDAYRGNWINILKRNLNFVKLVPVIGEDDSPAKSGPTMARKYNSELNVHNSNIIYPDAIEKAKRDGANLFIFIDDFCGTGKQFLRFFDEVNDAFDDEDCLIFMPLCMHSKGKTKIFNKHSNILVVAPENLSDEDRFFKEDAELLPDQVNTFGDLKVFYKKLLKQRVGNIRNPFGFGKLGLTYAFSHGTPNATLPLLWSTQNQQINLLKRH